MKYILGAGIAGLIYGFYNPEYYLISPEVGGQMKSNFNLGPRYLHDTQISRKFLNDIGYPIHRSSIRVSYIDDNGWVKNPDLEFRQKYYMKSRKINSLEGFDSSVMNSNKNEFDILLVNFDEIIKRLQSSIGTDRFLNETVSGVNRKTKMIDTLNRNVRYREYNHIVSTIPVRYLNNMLNPIMSDLPFESYDMTYVFTDEFQDMDGYDYVYDIRSSTPWHRMTKERYGLVLDFFGAIENNSQEFDSIRNVIRDSKVLRNAQIISRDDVKDLEDIKFIGRYGTWNRSWKTEKVIEESI